MMKQEDAVKAFESLRRISAQIDGLPAIQRIGGIARKQGWPKIGASRMNREVLRDRLWILWDLPLASYEAPSWAMKDLDGKEVRLEDYRKK